MRWNHNIRPPNPEIEYKEQKKIKLELSPAIRRRRRIARIINIVIAILLIGAVIALVIAWGVDDPRNETRERIREGSHAEQISGTEDSRVPIYRRGTK